MATAEEYDKAAARMRRQPTSVGGALDDRELIRLATLAASSHNTQPWKFRVRGQEIAVLPDYSRRCSVVDPDDAHLFKSLGCAAENLVHAAAAQGFAAEPHFDAMEDAVVVRLEPSLAANRADFSQAILKRQCTKLPYDGKSLSTSELRMLELAGNGPGVRSILLTEPGGVSAVIDDVSQGNAQQLTDPAFRRELISWIRFNPTAAMRSNDGLAGRTGGQPALPTWLATLLARIIITPRAQTDADARNLRSSSGVAVFVAARDDKPAWVETGRAYERFALQAAALDIRTAFVNQPIEVKPLRPQFESWLGLAGEHALLALRFGRVPLAPYSLRRPLEEVIAA